MAQLPSAIRLGLLLAITLSIDLSEGAYAVPVVWTGPTISVVKSGANPSDVNDPANQDRMTANVWLTRAGIGSGGMFNIVKESGYDFIGHTSPADTRWATNLVAGNEDKTIAATNWQQLNFTTWADAYDGPGSALIGNITTHNAVVKLVTDDIYLDLIFTGFNSSGFFAYDRSTPVTTSPTGDYNQNGAVDAGDYVIWRRTLGNSASPFGSGADGNSNGSIDQGDYTFWRERFGNAPVGLGAGLVSIPEPALVSAAVQLVVALVCTFRRRRGTAFHDATNKHPAATRRGNL